MYLKNKENIDNMVDSMTKRWALRGVLLLLSIAALISSLGTAFQTLPLNPDMAEMALIYQGIVQSRLAFPVYLAVQPR